jgi:hypothetical protein
LVQFASDSDEGETANHGCEHSGNPYRLRRPANVFYESGQLPWCMTSLTNCCPVRQEVCLSWATVKYKQTSANFRQLIHDRKCFFAEMSASSGKGRETTVRSERVRKRAFSTCTKRPVLYIRSKMDRAVFFKTPLRPGLFSENSL